jgi:hypothetical protein
LLLLVIPAKAGFLTAEWLVIQLLASPSSQRKLGSIWLLPLLLLLP